MRIMTEYDKRASLLSHPSLKPIFDDWRARGTDVDRLPLSFLESVSTISQNELIKHLRRNSF